MLLGSTLVNLRVHILRPEDMPTVFIEGLQEELISALLQIVVTFIKPLKRVKDSKI